ncbi:YegJ family protein [Zavarzinella formosa]|uniref:YegJ family protein n=1 Tax=Zavarzinella formosa TaxID=360055 RepID=UPI0003637656|nr:DUF2314 domain-containing protein [Zavarzinella formosa]
MGRILRIVLVLALIAGCGKKPPVDDPVTFVDSNDPKMNAAITKARASVNSFITALKSPKSGQSAFSIKMAFTEGDDSEQIWLTPVSYDGKNFQGTVNNTPVKVKKVRMGQKVTVSPSEISDWMYVENGKLVGGETLRVLRDGLTPAERKDFDKGMPFKIE